MIFSGPIVLLGRAVFEDSRIEWVAVLFNKINVRCEQIAMLSLPCHKDVHSAELFESTMLFVANKKNRISSKSMPHRLEPVDIEFFLLNNFEARVSWFFEGIRAKNIRLGTVNSLATRAHCRNLSRLRRFLDRTYSPGYTFTSRNDTP